jgi:hypothetical protein
VPHFLIFHLANITYPSFFNIEVLQNESVKINQCICKQFLRILKYFMKGIYEPCKEKVEFIKAKQLEAIIFNRKNKKCNFCTE